MKTDGQPSLPPDAPELVSGSLEDLDRGLDVTMVASATEGCALLDEVAGQLARGRTRVLRVAAPSPDGLTLAGLLTRLRPAIEGADQTPERAIEALTRLDATCDRVVLLVSSAETLERNALRAIQLAAEAQPKLRLVFAGTPVLLDILEHPDRSVLQDRLRRASAPQDGDEDEIGDWPKASSAVAAPLRQAPANDADRFYKIAAAGLGVVATIGLIIFVSHAGFDTATTRRPAAELARADIRPVRSQVESPAQPVPPQTVPPQTVDASRDVPAPVSDALAPALPGPQVASIGPPVSIQPLAPAAPAQPPAAGQQASLSPLLRHREPTLRRLPAPPRYASRPPADQPGADPAYADRTGRSVADAERRLDRLFERRADPQSPTLAEPRPQQDGGAWPLPADEPRGPIGVYSNGPGGVRSFRYGS